MMLSRTLYNCTAAAFGLAISSTAYAAATFGVAGYYGGRIVDGTPQPAVIVEFPSGNDLTTFAGTTGFAASASGSTNESAGSVSLSVSTANGNMGLHGSAASSIGGDPPFLSNGSATDGFDLYAYDIFHISGPAGTPEQFQYTLTLDSNSAVNVDGTDIGSGVYGAPADAYGGLQLYSDSNWAEPGAALPFTQCNNYGGGAIEADGNPCSLLGQIDSRSSSGGGGTLTGTITLIGGTTIQLGDMLWARSFASNAITATASFDASNTGFFTLTPITPGASFTTDSGLTYANSPDVAGAVPEPATWAMMLLGFGAVGSFTRRRRCAEGKSFKEFSTSEDGTSALA